LKSQDNKLWQQLCERAANEQDPTKLLGLANEICRLLGEQLEQTETEAPADRQIQRPVNRHKRHIRWHAGNARYRDSCN